MKLKAPDQSILTLPGNLSRSCGMSFLVAFVFLLLSFYSFAADGVWSLGSTTLAPTARYAAAAEWTGSDMIVWGGRTGASTFSNTGAKYNLATNAWITLPTFGTFQARNDHVSVWTGSEMIIWGGWANYPNFYNNGVRYNPSTSEWSAISQINAPISRTYHTAIWTG